MHKNNILTVFFANLQWARTVDFPAMEKKKKVSRTSKCQVGLFDEV
jgi:hypothetical protein